MIKLKQVFFIFISMATSNSMCMDDEPLIPHSLKTILLARCAQKLMSPLGYPNYVTSIAHNPYDSTQLAAGSWDTTIRTWDLKQQRCLTKLEHHKDIVSSIAYNPKHQQLASGSHDKTIALW